MADSLTPESHGVTLLTRVIDEARNAVGEALAKAGAELAHLPGASDVAQWLNKAAGHLETAKTAAEQIQVPQTGQQSQPEPAESASEPLEATEPLQTAEPSSEPPSEATGADASAGTEADPASEAGTAPEALGEQAPPEE